MQSIQDLENYVRAHNPIFKNGNTDYYNFCNVYAFVNSSMKRQDAFKNAQPILIITWHLSSFWKQGSCHPLVHILIHGVPLARARRVDMFSLQPKMLSTTKPKSMEERGPMTLWNLMLMSRESMYVLFVILLILACTWNTVTNKREAISWIEEGL